MAELTKSQVRSMTDEQIISQLERAADMERSNQAITYEHGLDLVNITAVHGGRLGAALREYLTK